MKKQLRKNFNPVDEQKYKDYRNRLHKIIQKCKCDYYKEQIKNCEHDLKKIYKIINEATNQINAKNSEKIQIKDNNKSFVNDKEMANFCNNYFVNVGIQMANKINNPNKKFQLQHVPISSMFLRPVREREIIEQIHSLKNNCTPGIDNVSSKLIKQFHIFLIKPLIHIINLAFRSGKVPSQFKTTVVSPIYKTGDKNCISNYRPISVINNFAKIFEKCLKDRLVHYLNVNKILSENQFGFKCGLGTSDAVYEFTKLVTENLDKNRKCLAVFLDLAKAFDTVPHNLLLEVLNNYGVRGSVLDVFASYLGGRKQRVKIDNTLSEAQDVKIGVPQGTVLGPILFIAYINSLTNMNINNGSLISYADDTVAIFSGETWAQVEASTKIGLLKIKNWLDSYKLTLNIEKTNYIAFSITAVNRPNFNHIEWDQLIIKEVAFTKYLGIIIDKHLKWDQHVLKLTKSIRKFIHKFYILRDIFKTSLLIDVYRTLIEALIRYGIIVWGGLYSNSLKQLNVVQNYILKIIYRKKKRYPTKLLYSEKIFNIRSLYILNSCIYVQKNTKLKDYVNHPYATRSNVNRLLKVPKHNRDISHRFLSCLAPKFYNIIPNKIKAILNIKKFSIECRKYLHQNQQKFETFLD